MRYQFIAEHHNQYPVSRQCAVLGVSRSAYYAWAMRQRQGLSSRAQADQKLRCWIEEVFQRHQGRYGRARLDVELRQAGWIVSGKRITRLLQELGLRPRQSRPSRPRRAKGSSLHPVLAENLLNRNFAPSMVQGPTPFGAATSLICPLLRAGFIWPWSWIYIRGASSAGQCRNSLLSNWPVMPWRWPSNNARLSQCHRVGCTTVCCIIVIRAANIPATPTRSCCAIEGCSAA